MWRLENDFAVKAKAGDVYDDRDDQPSFTEITLDVKLNSKFGTTGFGTTGFGATGYGPI